MKKKLARKSTLPTRLDLCRVACDATLLDALSAMDAGSAGIVLVVEEDSRLVATLTDGDVRRALLKGATLASPLLQHAQCKFVTVPPESGRAEVLDLMQARLIDQIPVVDRAGRLVGLHLLHEVIGTEVRPNWAVILAGGQGMRLRPVTEKLPKPMIPVAGKPILERLVLHLVGHGIRTIYLAIHYLGHIIEDHFDDGSRFGCAIHYLRENEALGTGGSLALLPNKPRDPLLVLNGDLLTQADIGALLRFHAAGGFKATMAVRRYGHQVPFGCVVIRHGKVVGLEEKPLMERMVNAGIYVVQPALLRRIPQGSFPITELFAACVARGESVGAFEVAEEWLDVGQREQLKPGRVP